MRKIRLIKYISVSELYKKWAKFYDSEANLSVIMDEKIVKNWIKIKGKDVLDLGCGTGRYAIPLSKENRVIGIDFSREMLNKARENAKKQKVKLELIQGDITKLKTNKKFDLILSMLVQDHIKDLGNIAKTIGNSSKIGTDVIISNLHPTYTIKAEKSKNKVKIRRNINFSTDQYYHPLTEYLSLLKPYGFVLEDYAEPIFTEKYAKMKEFRHLKSCLGKPFMVIYRFRRVR